MDPWHAALHAWQIDIDGNVNSWGLLWKLLSGSCILRVQSTRRQWYHQRLHPWVHLVPLQADLSDLNEQLEWCINHSKECAAIAAAGQALAQQVVAEMEDDCSAQESATRRHGCEQILDSPRLMNRGVNCSIEILGLPNDY